VKAPVIAFNHPSGAAEPSESDRMLTQNLIAACRPLGLKVLDHVIAGEEATFSFADSGLLDELELLCLAPGESGRHTRLSKTTD
jgi:DNA repair protein RadC